MFVTDLRGAVAVADAVLDAEATRLRDKADELEQAAREGEARGEEHPSVWVLAKGYRDAARALVDTRAVLALARRRSGPPPA